MIALEHAREQILAGLAPLPTESVPLLDGLERCLVADAAARLAAPPCDNSAFDGYAVRAADIASASMDCPVRLPVVGCTAAGSPPAGLVAPLTCHRIFTGAPMPAGSDAVLMQEDTLPAADDPKCILATASVRPWEGVRFAGEDFRKGTVLVPAGIRLKPQHLSVLAAGGLSRIEVPRRPRLRILSTGSELREPGEPLQSGQIPDSNGVLVEALARAAGAVVCGRDRIADDLPTTLAALRIAGGDADVIVTTGGVSVGDADLLRPAVEQLGGRIDFWRIAMKPGKPFVFGRLGQCWWFGLPGNPASAFVTWWQLVRPALFKLSGAKRNPAELSQGILASPLVNRGDRRHFVRVRLDTDGLIHAGDRQASHLQSPTAHANALADVPPGTAWEAGQSVTVERTDL